MKKLPLLARAFEDQSIEEFYKHAKDLAKPQKPKTVLRKKKINEPNSESRSKPSIETNRETKEDAGPIEA